MPVITISRGTFSGGRALAECLSRRLGYPCLSREEAFEGAREYGISVERLLQAIDNPQSFWRQLTAERTNYLSYLRKAMCDRMRDYNLIYHGHAGHLLLSGISHVIRVRLNATAEYRIKSAMARLNLDRKAAIAHIEKADRERVKWTRFLYGGEWHDPWRPAEQYGAHGTTRIACGEEWYNPSYYDVVFNLGPLTLESACDLVVQMAGMDEFQPTPASRQAVADLALGCRVWAALARDDRTRGISAKVTAQDGVVTVVGTARSRQAVADVPAVARQVEGVKEVRYDVSVGAFLV